MRRESDCDQAMINFKPVMLYQFMGRHLKNFILLIIPALCISCSGNDPNVKIQANSIVNSGYYQCDYSKNQYDTILSSGTSDTLTEIWGIEPLEIKKLKQVNIDSVDFNAIIQKGKVHLNKRFLSADLQFSSLEIKEDNSRFLRFFFVELTFLDTKSGGSQKIPFLLDGTIILSNNEVNPD